MSGSIEQKEMKILLLQSGGRCAFPGCSKFLVQEGSVGDAPSIIGEIAHIVAERREGPRGRHELTDEERNSHRNLVLLCREHHKIVDDQPLTYSIPILREIKASHEAKIQNNDNEIAPTIDVLLKETTYSTFLAVSNLPAVVYKGPCDFDKGDEDRVRQLVKYPDRRSELAAYIFQPGWLYTFHDLRLLSNPFIQIVDPSSAEEVKAIRMWSNPDEARIYFALMNSALRRYLGSLRVSYDRDHRRFYFPTLVGGQERSVDYKSLTGRTVSRMVVWQPKRRSTGEPKNFWWHFAASLSFHELGERVWALSIRPERHLTIDGEVPLPSELIGRRVTRLKARMYNSAYLAEVNFWREFLSQGKPRIILDFGSQSAIVQTNLVPVEMEWPGVIGDEKAVSFDVVEDDLFTSAEFSESLEGDEIENEGEDE
jgi:hypothetical protein